MELKVRLYKLQFTQTHFDKGTLSAISNVKKSLENEFSALMAKSKEVETKLSIYKLAGKEFEAVSNEFLAVSNKIKQLKSDIETFSNSK
ncbi:hypothetical protein AYI69_g3802 [Smittium culicis]|uniref:Uncharacterized protein n=1 Tax=Smittium culicis TaxID=133412 RepID=A0A1R1YIN5_9FUNG|nr:hypothetical protein AYI69_g3802 [Smittium culicis]